MPVALKFIISIIIPQLAGGIGSLFTFSSVSTWYQTLEKPAINPPNWIFGPVWTTLFLLMGIALFLVWKKEKSAKKKLALVSFAIQLFLNVLWSVLFFGFQNPALALGEIFLLWLAIVINIYFFYQVSKSASLLLLPYLGWVSFAVFLNYHIWTLN